MTLTPEEVLAAAQGEPRNHRPVSGRGSPTFSYMEAVHTLREKHWSWRQIAEWMDEKTGVKRHQKSWGDNYVAWMKARAKK